MAETKLHIQKPGMLTLIQDGGRSGWQKYGIPAGGALDQAACKTANWLVGNPLQHPVLEITVIGPQIKVEQDCQIAVTGADMAPTVNGITVGRYETLNLTAGSILSFGRLRSGCRAYLAVGGDWKINKWLGSGSAAIFSGKNLLAGSRLQQSQEITIQTRPFISPKKVDAGEWPFSFSEKNQTIRVVPGPDFRHFSREVVARFFSTTFHLANDSNRMGCRLSPTLPDYRPKQELISSGTTPGTLQITNAGQPIVLLADAQTTGGYPRLANVIHADLDCLAQLKPGDEIRFVMINLEEAYLALAAKNNSLRFLTHD